jgi:iron(III) transport system ATP-binding protein
MAVIAIDKVTKRFHDAEPGTPPVIAEFDQVIGDREFVTLLGPSGCGKTTMLRMIAGFEKPSSGEIRIDERVVSSAKTFVPPEKRGIGMVFQSYAVWPHMTVFENVAYPLKIAKVSKSEIKIRVAKALEVVHLSQYAQRIPSQLSGGQQQRVALGRALVSEPKLLLLDEPLSNLDAKLRESMRFEIKEIQKKFGITVVYVTHDQTEAMAMSDRIMVMNRGIVQQVAVPTEIYRRPANQFVADFVGKVNFFTGIAADGKINLSGIGQSIPYEGPYAGKVVVAVRPENIVIAPEASGGPAVLEGSLLSMFYLGDINDCRVDINGTIIRVIAESVSFDTLKEGQKISLGLKEFLVYEDKEEEATKIVT